MCCGRSRATVAPFIPATRASLAPQPRPVFEYKGATALTVVSPLTGKTYRFAQPGARVDVDPRDRPWISFVPQLAKV